MQNLRSKLNIYLFGAVPSGTTQPMLTKRQASIDLLSGFTVSLALVPEAVAFAFVAGLAPLAGLYAAFIVGLITALMGGRPGMISKRHRRFGSGHGLPCRLSWRRIFICHCGADGHFTTNCRCLAVGKNLFAWYHIP